VEIQWVCTSRSLSDSLFRPLSGAASETPWQFADRPTIDHAAQIIYFAKLGQKTLRRVNRPICFLTIWVWEAEKKISERN
jgi:hypothetical protein